MTLARLVTAFYIECAASDVGHKMESHKVPETTTEFGLPIDRSFGTPATADALQRAAKALRAHNHSVEIANTVADARTYVSSILPKDQMIFTASSETVRLSGLDDEINKSGNYRSIRQQMAKLDPKTQMSEMKRLGATPDVVVGSVHAVTEEGQLVVGSATGSQLGPYATGAGKAIFVVGAQKVVPDLEAAIRRLRFYSYPLEDIRARKAYGNPSTLAKILIINSEFPPGRSTVVLIREPIGF
jgi:acyl-CoA hydrolase